MKIKETLSEVIIIVFAIFASIRAEGYAECGVTTSCFGSDDGCLQTGNCFIMITYQYIRSSSTFNFMIQGDGIRFGNYLALGISTDTSMGNDLVFFCINSIPGTMTVSWNVGKSNTIDVTGVQLDNYVIQSVNSITTCNFTVNSVMNPNINGQAEYFDLGTKAYYIFLATGATNGVNLNKHSFKMSSIEPIDLKKNSLIHRDGSKLSGFKAHGCLMALAWLAAAPSGMLIARYMKRTWTGIKPFGKDLWFRCHQFFMGITVILTALGFVVMLGVEGFDPLKAKELQINGHAAVGLISILCSFAQPIMAFFRPEPGTSKRYIFNYAHWTVGYVGYIFALAALFLSIQLESIGLPHGLTYALVVFVIMLVLAHVILVVHKYLISANPPSIDGHDPMDPDAIKDAPGSNLRKVVLSLAIAFFWIFSFVFLGVIGEA